MEGTVKFFNCAKGWGFVLPDAPGPDVFVHHVHIQMAGYRFLTEGQRVAFEAEDTPKGRAAVSVRVVDR